MSDFPHLPFPKKIEGLHKPPKGGGDNELNEQTRVNLVNRQQHGQTLLNNLDHLSEYWQSNIKQRKEDQLPDLPNPDITPVFLQIDAKDLDVESLKGFGVEIIAEEENGFIIGASSMDFISLKEKINQFLTQTGKSKNQASKLWSINTGKQWKLEQIVSDELQNKWDQIQDTDVLIVDVGIACYIKTSPQPTKSKTDSSQKFNKRFNKWASKKAKQDQARDELSFQRQNDFEALIQNYSGELLSSYADYEDSFSCRIKLSGRGLKDLVFNYQYLFEVSEYDPLEITDSDTNQIQNIAPNLLAPGEGYPSVCVIDSGIQQEHRLLAPAVDVASSVSFIPNDTSTADTASQGGHGTRVAGAILYPRQIPRNGDYQLPCFIQNAKVMTAIGGRTVLPESLFPPTLMKDIVERFDRTRIFNMSINVANACKTTHMSQWAASIDQLMHERNILFVLSAGNIKQTESRLRPGITDHIAAGRDYPSFLLEQSSRIANPAQSCFALSVGSVCHEEFDDGLRESFGKRDNPSPFTRTGLGIWGMIKPDVVEYGGDLAREKAGPNISYESSIAPELVKSTYNGGAGVGSDQVGTSFAAPKVSHIAATLQRLYPTESANMYRALIVQSARLPQAVFANPTIDHIRQFGYGIPDINRATENSDRRITFIASETIAAKQAHVYSINIPDRLRNQGEDFDILIEVTLSFTSKTRRTRRRTNSYLSSWLDWHSCKLEETHEQFLARIHQNMEQPDDDTNDQRSIQWVIRERTDWSRISNVKRQDSSLQKSWCVIKSYRLPEVFDLAIVGHKGWENDLSEDVPYSIAVSFELLSGAIPLYELIRAANQIEVPTGEIQVEI